tara:strand:+ start:499 stop:1638 length:1140 start_codon:yes stop_codon:yes gene_type:complete
MAYCKIVLNTGSTLVYSTDVFNIITDVIDGTIDSQADLEAASYSTGVNLGASTYTGTKPTAGIYSIEQFNSGGSNSGSWYVSTYIKKYHYAKNQVSGFDPYQHIWLETEDSYAFRWTVADSAGNLKLPTNSRSRYWTKYNNDTNWKVGDETMDYIHNIHIICNDTTLAIWVEYNTMDANGEVAWVAITDHEFRQTVDTYMHSAEATWYPGSAHWGLWMNTLQADAGDSVGTTDDTHAHASGKIIFLDAAGGTWRAPDINDESNYHWQPATSASHGYPMLYPAPYLSVRATKASTGIVHQLVPLNYLGQHNDNVTYGDADPEFARLMNWYRTTDNLTMGTRIQVGSDFYRVFRGWNCGTSDPNTAAQKACVAFPENNVPY